MRILTQFNQLIPLVRHPLLVNDDLEQDDEQIVHQVGLISASSALGSCNVETGEENLVHTNDYWDAVSHISETISDAVTFYTTRASLSNSTLERSESFYPEQYVVEGTVYERTLVCCMMELSRSATTRTDKYYLLFKKDARRWRHVTITATIAHGSRIAEVSASCHDRAVLVSPGAVQPKMEAALATTELYDLVTNISIEILLNDQGSATFDAERYHVAEDLQEAPHIKTSELVREVEYRGIPQYLESEVITVSRVGSQCYHVVVESTSCFEKKMPFQAIPASGIKLTDEFFADMKLIQLAQGCPAVPKLLGVVLTDDRLQLCSYLLEHTGAKSCHTFFAKARLQGTLISWKRRELWIRQTIKALADIHGRGVSVGQLNLSVIAITNEHKIMFRDFKSRASDIQDYAGGMPPELRQSTAPLAFATGKNITFQTDIFQLGLFIWQLAEHVGAVQGLICRKNGCNSVPRYRCTADHANPVQLPPCSGGEIPLYIDEIIRLCRQEQPDRRPPARTLLDLMPAEIFFNLSPEAALQNHERNENPIFTYCDECGGLITEEHYHCHVCNDGAFDLCPPCFFAGISCFHDSHIMESHVLEMVNMFTRV